MADIKISQLTEVAASTGTDLLECVQSGASRRTTVQKLLDWIKAQATTWTGKQTFQGYTVLGESAPGIKTKVLTGTTAAAEGGQTGIAHGLISAKIIGVNVFVEHIVDGGMSPETTSVNGFQYSYWVESTNLIIRLHATNSENILSKPIKAFITYRE